MKTTTNNRSYGIVAIVDALGASLYTDEQVCEFTDRSKRLVECTINRARAFHDREAVIWHEKNQPRISVNVIASNA